MVEKTPVAKDVPKTSGLRYKDLFRLSKAIIGIIVGLIYLLETERPSQMDPGEERTSESGKNHDFYKRTTQASVLTTSHTYSIKYNTFTYRVIIQGFLNRSLIVINVFSSM